MRRLVLLVAALAIAGCSGSGSNDTSSSGSGSSNGGSSSGGSTGNSSSTGSTGNAACTDNVTSPFSFSGDCTVNAATGASASQGGQDAGALFILSSASEGGITFNAQFNDGTLSARDYTQDDTRHWSLLVTDDSGGPGATVSYLRAQSDTFGAFTLHLTSASADSFGTIDAHGTLSASYNQPLDDGGSTAIAVDSSF